jgi:hypothetical protein
LIARSAGMTDEERGTSGWTPALYDKMVALQSTRDKLASLFNADGGVATTGSMTLLDSLG